MTLRRRAFIFVALSAPVCTACVTDRAQRAARPENVVLARPVANGPAAVPATPAAAPPAAAPASPKIASTPSALAQVQFVAPPEELPPAATRPVQPLTLPELLQAVDATYPLVQAALQERAIADGQRLSAQGGFDLNVDAYSLAQPLGFYKMYRSGVMATQPMWQGGYVYGGYRIGDGNYPPWYGERETNEGGEFKLGATLPLWRDRPIDKRRAALAQANLARAAAEPSIQAQLLEIDRAAAMAYWSWVAAGQSLRIERSLLRVTEERNAAIKRRVELGDLPGSEAVDNDRVVALRRLKVVAAERKLQESAIKLSLFLRSPDGQPLVPTPEVLPPEFPPPLPPRTDNVELAIDRALSARPEIRELNLLRQSLSVDLRMAENLTRPTLDATVWGSKDVGAAASEKKDKTPYEMEGGLVAEVPLQRREARGKIRAVQAKLAQLNAKQRFTNDKIAAEVRDAQSAITLSYVRVRDASANAALARQVENFERRRFDLGDSNIFMVNQRETAAVEAGLAEIEALADYQRALANFRTSLADRAAELPPTTVAGANPAPPETP